MKLEPLDFNGLFRERGDKLDEELLKRLKLRGCEVSGCVSGTFETKHHVRPTQGGIPDFFGIVIVGLEREEMEVFKKTILSLGIEL